RRLQPSGGRRLRPSGKRRLQPGEQAGHDGLQSGYLTVAPRTVAGGIVVPQLIRGFGRQPCCNAQTICAGGASQKGAAMGSIRETAERFFDACETGKGWDGCQQYCHPSATFTAQAGALAGVETLQGYTDWMKGLFT